MAIARTMANTTTPTPSLKSDSPAILASSVAGMRTVLRIPRTATGSVGLIRAPNTKAQMKGSSTPARLAICQMPAATMKVEMRTPTLAISPIDQRRSASVGQIHMHRAGEQKRAQDAVQQHLGEIERIQCAAHRVVDDETRNPEVGENQRHRCAKARSRRCRWCAAAANNGG